MNTRRLVSIAIFTALITIGGLISVPIPFTQVQLSFQTVFVITAGLVLGARDGALSVLVYVTMGLLGLPVFTQGGGPQYIFMPSFGYLIGFPIGAFVTGLLRSKLKSATRGKIFLCALCGCVPVYVIGVVYQVAILYFYIGSAWGAVIAGVPAIGVLFVKDSVLCGFSSILYPSLKKALRRDDVRRTEKRKKTAEK